MLSPSMMYSLRTTNLLDVPPPAIDVISSMQLAPVPQVYYKKTAFKKHTSTHVDHTASWRTDVVVSMKRMEFKHDDPDYVTVNGIINKVSTTNISTSVEKITEIVKTRKTDEFRLRVVTLLFNRGVSMPFYSKLIANVFELMHVQVPEIREDLCYSCSLDTFSKMFEQSDTVTCPALDDLDYDEKLCKWVKSREIRRGFGMFVTELHVRGLVDEDVIVGAIKYATEELTETVRKHSDKMLSETVDQLVTLLFETCKIIVTRFGKEHPIVKILVDYSKQLCSIPKTDTPSMGMRSRFKLEDIQKF